LPKAVWAYEDSVSRMYDARLHYARDDGSDKRYGEGVVDMELERCRAVVVAVVGQNVEEGAHKVEIVSSDIGDLEDGAYSPRHKLGGCVDALLLVLDEDWYLASAGGLQDFGELRDGLLQNLRRANVDFSDADHDRDIERKSNSKVLFAHADQSVVRGHHE
jgi:hypothetical protein